MLIKRIELIPEMALNWNQSRWNMLTLLRKGTINPESDRELDFFSSFYTILLQSLYLFHLLKPPLISFSEETTVKEIAKISKNTL